MKKISAYSAIAALLSLSAVSCNTVSPVTPMDDAEGIQLELSSLSPRTKATEPGVDGEYNENTINTLDWFIYKEEAGTTLLKYGRTTSFQDKTVTEEGKEKTLKTCSLPIEDTDTDILSGDTYYLYAIANVPSNVKITGKETLAQLKDIAMESDFVGSHKQSSFVMDNIAPQEFVAETNPVRVKLTRLAAKVTMSIKVKTSVEVDEKTYTPIISSMGVNLVYTNQKETLKGEKNSYDESLTPDANPIKIYDYYTVGNGLTQLMDKGDDGKETPRIITVGEGESAETYYLIETDPYYTYPQKWTYSGGGDPRQPYLKIKLPWQSDKGKNFYYKILIPGTTEGDTEFFERNNWYHINLTVSILGNEFDEAQVLVEGNMFVFDWGDTSEDFSTIELIPGQYLYTAQDTYTIYSTDDLTIPVVSSHKLNETVTVNSVTKNNYSSITPVLNQNVTTTYTGAKATSGVFKVSTEGKDKLIFHNRLTTLKDSNLSDLDVSPITFNLTISNAAGLSTTVKVIQIPPIVIESQKNSGPNNGYGYVYVNGYNDRINHDNLGRVGSSADGSSDNANPNMYIIESSLLPESLGYTIGDPRSSSVYNLGDNWSTTAQGRRLSYYHPSSDSEEAKSIIAPKFRIASSHGKLFALYQYEDYLITYENAQRRCASYQEDGYPAGRWRVPTKAEIEFMIMLSNQELIPSLFSETNKGRWDLAGYFSADGGAIFPWNDKTIGYKTKDEIGKGSVPQKNGVRCVYDEWYWGSDRVNVNTFTWGDRQTF